MGRPFGEAPFILLVMSEVEMETLTPKKAADILGIKTREVEVKMTGVKKKENAWNQGGSLS